MRASQATIQYLKSYLADYKNDLIHHPNSRNETQGRIDETSADIFACTNPVINPNPDSVREAKALRHFLDIRCQSAPCLLKVTQTEVRANLHSESMMGGYLIVMLMTKVPGSALEHDTFCKMSRPQRDEIRQAFRRALMLVNYTAE